MHLCVPFTIDLFLWHEIVVLPNQQEVVKNNTICSSLQKKTEQKRFGAKKRSKSTFSLYKYSRHVSSTMSVLHTYTMKYSILSIFRAKQKMTLRPSRKHCSPLCVFVMKEYLLNCSSIRLDYDLLVFSSRFLLPKMKVFDIWKKELSTFHELLESARARASFENWFCVESRVTAFTGKKNQVKRLLSRWSTTLFRCTCLYGHWIKEFFNEPEHFAYYQ